jgi:hypothetical protein
VLFACVASALIGLDQASGTKLNIATASEKASYQVYRDLWIFGAEASLVVMLLLAARWFPRVLAPALAVLGIALPVVHNRHFLQYDPLGPFLDYVQNQPSFAPLLNAPQPVRVLEENRLKSDEMLSSVGTASGYHPVILESYDWLSRSIGLDTEVFTGTMAVNFARTYTPRLAAAGAWQSAGHFRKAGRAEFLWRRDPGGDYFPAARVQAVDGGTAGERLAYMDWQKDQLAATRTSNDQDQGNSQPQKSVALDAAFVSRDKIQRLQLAEGPQPVKGWLMSWSPNHIQLRLASTVQGQRSLLRLAEVTAPGWQAKTVRDGIPIPVTSVNGSQRALAVPYGEGVVHLEYAPFSFRLGLFCSLGTLTLGLSAALGTMVRRARRLAKLRKVRRRTRKEVERGVANGIDGTATA